MSRKCRECRKGTLNVIGLGPYEDTIEVECDECGESYEVEPDGLGDAGLEMMEAFDAEQKRVQREEAEQARAAKQIYGFTVPESVNTYWSARGIYTWRNGEVNIDILPDRQSITAEDKESAQALANWLNKDGLPGLQAVCQRERIQSNEASVAEYRAEGFFVTGNPNGSYGYLYIVAYREVT